MLLQSVPAGFITLLSMLVAFALLVIVAAVCIGVLVWVGKRIAD